MNRSIAVSDEVFHRLERQASARGVTIAQLLDQFTAQAEEGNVSAAVERLRATGLLLAPGDYSNIDAEFEPIEVQGAPLSEVIIAERR